MRTDGDGNKPIETLCVELLRTTLKRSDAESLQDLVTLACRELIAARVALGPFDKDHDNLRGCINNLRQAYVLAKENAAAVGDLLAVVSAAEGTICHGCGCRIGYTDPPKKDYLDWRKCASCHDVRAAIAVVRSGGKQQPVPAA